MSLIRVLLCLVPFLVLAAPCLAEPEEPGKQKPQLRLILVSCPEEPAPLRLMSKNEEGEWREHAEFEARSSFITDWMPVRSGRLFLTKGEPAEPRVVGSLDYPQGTRRAVAVLFHDPQKEQFRADLIDPADAGFRQGSSLVVNYTSRPGAVSLGGGMVRIEPGGRRVVKPSPEDNGMYRMTAAYTKPEEKPVLCYDRYVAANPEARDFLLLLPDPTLGMRVFRLSEFGPFE